MANDSYNVCACATACVGHERSMVKPTNLPKQYASHVGTCLTRNWIGSALLVLTLLWTSGEVANARHEPTRHDRRPDRETRIRYPRTPRTSQNPPSGTLHSAPATATPVPTAPPE
jgi:hypothetical protein